jgi:hypothetical protein
MHRYIPNIFKEYITDKKEESKNSRVTLWEEAELACGLWSEQCTFLLLTVQVLKTLAHH